MGEDPKLDSLEERIAAARKAEGGRVTKEHFEVHAVRGKALEIASTMIGYPVGGIVVGLVLDKVFGTLPWLTIALMFLAFVGACIRVVRVGKDDDTNGAG